MAGSAFDSVWFGLALVFVMTLGFGGALSFSSWQNKLKDVFNLSQTQVEILSSSLIVSTHAGLIGGILLDRYGPRRTGLVSMPTVLGHLGLLWTLYHPDNFNKHLFPVLIFLFIIDGLGVSIGYIAGVSTFIQNFGADHGGRMFISGAIAVYGSLSIINTGIFGIKQVFIVTAIIQLTSSLCCIFLLRRKSTPTGGASSSYTRLDETGSSTGSTVSSSGEIDESAVGDNTSITNAKTSKESRNVTDDNDETTRIISTAAATPAPPGGSIYGDVAGFEIMKLQDFWIIMTIFIVSTAMDKSFFTNVATYLRSFGHERHLTTILSIAPWFSVLTKIVVGLVSDFDKEKSHRLVILIISSFVKLVLFTLFIFMGDNIVLLYVITFFVFATFGTVFVIGPVLIAEYFGYKNYPINYGCAMFADGCLSLLVSFIIGLLYDAHVTEITTHTCFGLHCYYVSSGILCALSLVTLIASVAIYYRRRIISR